MNRESRLSWNAWLSIARIVAFAVLAIPAALQAQAGECQPSGSEVCGIWANGFGVDRFGGRVKVLSVTAPAASIASTEETGAGPVPSRTLGMNLHESLMDLCEPTVQCSEWFQAREQLSWPIWSIVSEPLSGADRTPNVVTERAAAAVPNSKSLDLNRRVYYKNKLEFSLDGGWLPINIPFVFDVFLGDAYNTTSLKYTLVPIIASIRWQIDDVGGPWIFRGNWDLQCSGTYTFIPRGPETRYIAWILGVRRNFVPRRGKIAPYFDGRLGMGNIDAKEPLGVLYAQGQDFTFTVNMGAGARYNFNPRYSISAGLNWMHISNLYLSEPEFSNYGINVYGPMFGFNVRLGKPRFDNSE